MRRVLMTALGFAASLAALATIVRAADDPCARPVSATEGPVIGKMEAGPVCAYKGVPYAAAPVGDRRWRPPAPAPARTEPLRALDFGAVCLQSGSGNQIPVPGAKKPKKSEDCLFLNIWRPMKDGTFPVMVWIHGGSLVTGAGSDPLYWGDRLAGKEDVVVVTINYRLGFYGFLAHPALSGEDPNHSSGNYGLLDQIAALKWVQANIAGFGGDPHNVTIFGESAGGWSTCNLLASPLAAGLFQKAVIESGGCDAVSTLQAGYSTGEKFARRAGCEGARPLDCLRATSPVAIDQALEAAAQREKREKKEKKSGLSLEAVKMEWVPRADGWALKTVPVSALRQGEFNRVPLLVGSNRDEAKLFTLVIPGVRLIPKAAIRPELKKAFGNDVAAGIEKLYPYDRYRRPADAIIDAIGDMALGCKCFDAADAVAAFAPVYYYRFDYDDHLLPHLLGAAHGLEIPFVFNNLDRPPAGMFMAGRQTPRGMELSGKMMRYWANFARGGDPNGQGLVPWPAYDRTSRRRMIFDLPLQAAPADNLEKCEFWRSENFTLGG